MKKVNYHKKATEEAKRIVRSKGVCEKCNRTKETNQMHGSHILSVGAYPNMSAELENILCLCAGCHKRSGNSWHNEPSDNIKWFKQKFPGRLDQLYKIAQTMVKVDWEMKYKGLKEFE